MLTLQNLTVMSDTKQSSNTDRDPSTATKNGSVSANDDEVKVIGEKRKAETSAKDETQSEGGGGKDLVESKQTTLDDIVQHEKQESEKTPSEPVAAPSSTNTKTTKGDKDGERASKKSKPNTDDKEPVKSQDSIEVDESEERKEEAATPPSQLSQTEASLDRPHKSVKKLDLADKATETSTPTKSIKLNQDGEGGGEPVSSPLKPGAGAGGEKETVPGDEVHLDHPENWTTGDEPATEKQKGYIKVLEQQKGGDVGDISGIGKSEASDLIDQLTSGSGSSSTVNPTSTSPQAQVQDTSTSEGNGNGNGTTNAHSGAADAETVPGDEAHLDHPENWTTGGEPATDKQKGFLKVLEKQKGVEVGDVGSIGKSEASEKIDELKNM